MEFPADFPVAEMAGKTGRIRRHRCSRSSNAFCLPVDDAFAAKWMPEKTLSDLRHALEHQIEHEKGHELERAREAQVVKFLNDEFSSSCRRIS